MQKTLWEMVTAEIPDTAEETAKLNKIIEILADEDVSAEFAQAMLFQRIYDCYLLYRLEKREGINEEVADCGYLLRNYDWDKFPLPM